MPARVPPREAGPAFIELPVQRDPPVKVSEAAPGASRGPDDAQLSGRLKVDDHIGLNPRRRRFAGLLDDGRLVVVQGVGYPNPTRSHFQSAVIWQTARLDATHRTQGWLSRDLDATGAFPQIDFMRGD